MNLYRRKMTLQLIGAVLVGLGVVNLIDYVKFFAFQDEYGLILKPIITLLYIIGGIQLIGLKESGRKIVETICWFHIVTGLLGAVNLFFWIIADFSVAPLLIFQILIVGVAALLLRFINHQTSREIINPSPQQLDTPPPMQ